MGNLAFGQHYVIAPVPDDLLPGDIQYCDVFLAIQQPRTSFSQGSFIELHGEHRPTFKQLAISTSEIDAMPPPVLPSTSVFTEFDILYPV